MWVTTLILLKGIIKNVMNIHGFWLLSETLWSSFPVTKWFFMGFIFKQYETMSFRLTAHTTLLARKSMTGKEVSHGSNNPPWYTLGFPGQGHWFFESCYQNLPSEQEELVYSHSTKMFQENSDCRVTKHRNTHFIKKKESRSSQPIHVVMSLQQCKDKKFPSWLYCTSWQ